MKIESLWQDEPSWMGALLLLCNGNKQNREWMLLPWQDYVLEQVSGRSDDANATYQKYIVMKYLTLVFGKILSKK